jgi:2-methylcitrate dehydratase
VVPGVVVRHGASVLGTSHSCDPVAAAHSTATAVRWLDANDTWLAEEWVHPSDAIGAVLPLAEYLSKARRAKRSPPFTMKDVLVWVIKAYEIVGVLALENPLNAIGLDGTLFTKVAVAAVCARMLGGGRSEVADAASHAFADGASLRCFRHDPNASFRKAWAAGDAASRGVWIALMTMRGERGLRTVLTAPVWGFNDVFNRRDHLRRSRAFEAFVAENVSFKPFPASSHAQTAVEASFALHPRVVHRIDEIHSVVVHTTRSGVRTLDTTGSLNTPADRDRCLRYVVAVGLLYGALTAEHYEDGAARDPRIEELRKKIIVMEDPQYSADYLDPDRRSVTNAVQIHFVDRTSTSKVEVQYPLGHKRRRSECFPALEKKLIAALRTRMPSTRAGRVFERVIDPQQFDTMSVPDFVDLFSPNPDPYLASATDASPRGFLLSDAATPGHSPGGGGTSLGAPGIKPATGTARAEGYAYGGDGWDLERDANALRIEYPDR